MSANIRTVFLLFCVLLYGVCYSYHDRNMQERQVTLQSAPPLIVLQAITGYFRQITSEILFVRTSVFLGGLKPGADELEYEAGLAHNLRTMTSLYPEFIDPYFFTNGFLAPISKYGAGQASFIFETGIDALPDDFILRFYNGANYFYHLNEPLRAAEVFAEAAKLADAPIIFSRLAAIFSAHGGNLRAGLVMLHTMAKAEEEEIVKERYLEEITYFEKAIVVQNAVDLYTKGHGSPPEKLDLLVPGYISNIPDLKKRFVLVYEPPDVTLRRPGHKTGSSLEK